MTTTIDRTQVHDQIITTLGYTPKEVLLLLPARGTGPAGMLRLVDACEDPDLLTSAITELAAKGLTDVAVVYFTTRNPLDLTATDEVIADACQASGAVRSCTMLFNDDADTVAIHPADDHAQQAALEANDATEASLAVYLDAVHTAGKGEDLSPAQIGAAAATLKKVQVRDCIVVDLAGRHLPDEVRDDPSKLTEDLAGEAIMTLLQPDPSLYDDARLSAHRDLLTAIVAHLPVQHHAPARSLLGIVTWRMGERGVAHDHLAHALSADPTYSLARLVQQAITTWSR